MGCGSCGSGSGGCGSGGCGTGGACGTASCPALQVHDWLAHMGLAPPSEDLDVVEVKFKGQRKGFYQNAGMLDVQVGDMVIVEADRGIDLGMVNLTGELVRVRLKTEAEQNSDKLPKVIRPATPDELETYERKHEDEAEASIIGRELVAKMRLKMKISDVEWQFDRNRITFYFTADRRVDFRKLVREMARRFRTRVELRQIGARDEAARIGGIGSCGRELCCSTWMQRFKPVAMHAAKVQDLPLNPVRLSGQCGRLKCCLNYELEQYTGALKRFPRVGRPVQTTRGKGVVQKVDIFREELALRFEGGTSWETFTLEELNAIRVRKDRDTSEHT